MILFLEAGYPSSVKSCLLCVLDLVEKLIGVRSTEVKLNSLPGIEVLAEMADILLRKDLARRRYALDGAIGVLCLQKETLLMEMLFLSAV